MVTEMWIRQTDRSRDSKGLAYDSIVLSLALAKLLKSSATDVRPMTHSFGISQKQIALLLLKPFRRVVYEGQFWMTAYPVIVDVHLELFRRVPELYAGIPFKDIIYDIYYALTYLTSLPDPESPQLPCIKKSFKFLAGLSSLASSYTLDSPGLAV